jgi:hypothetical protein
MNKARVIAEVEMRVLARGNQGDRKGWCIWCLLVIQIATEKEGKGGYGKYGEREGG